MDSTRPILIVGLPRSGTTWFGEVLSSANNTRYIFEPDNEGLSSIAWWGKRKMHRYPYLSSDDVSEDYYRIWHSIINGHPLLWYVNAGFGLFARKNVRSIKYELEAHMGDKCGFRYLDSEMHWVSHGIARPYDIETHPFMAFVARHLLINKQDRRQRKRIIIKSVHSSLSLDWLAANFPLQIILILRNPYSLFASYKRMRLPDGSRNILYQPTLQRDMYRYLPEKPQLFTPEVEDLIAFQIMLMYKIIQFQSIQHPDWMLVSHDRLCISPHEDYRNIFTRLGLGWSKITGDRIDSLNKQGKDFSPSRISKQQPSKWKSELTESERRAVENWTDRFELRSFLGEKINVE